MKYLKIYGLQRSGTNYLKALLEKNFDIRILQNIGGSKHQQITGKTISNEVETDIDIKEIEWIDKNFHKIPKICIYKPFKEWEKSFLKHKKQKVGYKLQEKYTKMLSHWSEYCDMVNYNELKNTNKYLQYLQKKYNLKRKTKNYQDINYYMSRGGDKYYTNYLKFKILVIIPAYNANNTIQNAVDSLNNQATKHKIDVVVIDDCSTDNTAQVKGAKVHRNIINVGCYQSINKALEKYIDNYDYWLIHGADDISSPLRIESQMKIINNGAGCYYQREKISFGHSTMIYSKKVFDKLGYYDNTRFGGDSEYFYRFSKYFKIDIIKKCLYFTHGSKLSKKYKNKRESYVLNFKTEDIMKRNYFNEKITIGIASINKNLLKKTVDSLINQCDEMIIGLNNYNEIPKYLNNKKIKAYLLDNKYGDAAKYLEVDKVGGWYLSCDDDLIYPNNYANYMIKKAKQYKTLVTAHGRIMNAGKIDSYYKGHTKMFNCLRENTTDTEIDIAGSGVACFHTSMANIKLKEFKYPNMADIYLSAYFNKIICVKHTTNWLVYQTHENNIFKKYYNNDKIQTQEYNKLNNE